MKVTKLKPSLCTTYIKLWKNFERSDRDIDRNGSFHSTLIPPSQTLNCWTKLRELILVCQYAKAYLKPPNFTLITIFTVELN